MLAFRSVVSVLVSFVRSFSTPSRPALRAASGPATTRRSPENRPHPSGRATGTGTEYSAAHGPQQSDRWSGLLIQPAQPGLRITTVRRHMSLPVLLVLSGGRSSLVMHPIQHRL
jgi:hypothetical protein